MTLNTVVFRSLKFYWRTHVAVALGVAAAAAALAGALIVGDSMRASLRDLAIGRLGQVDHALVAQRFFRAELADALCAGDDPLGVAQAVPVILLNSSAAAADSGRFVGRVNLLGVDERFWGLADDDLANPTGASGRGVVLNTALAGELGVESGDDVVLRIARPQSISPETLLGRRDETGLGRRLRVHAVVPDVGMGRFGLTHSHATPRNAYMRLGELQRLLDRDGQANVLLARDVDGAEDPLAVANHLSTVCIKESLQPADVGFTVRVVANRGYAVLESDALLLEPGLENAVQRAADGGLAPAPIISYLANAIVCEGAEVPYSVVAAVDERISAQFEAVAGDPTPRPGTVVLNDWTARAVGAQVGAAITLTYYTTGRFGRLETHSTEFTCGGIVALRGAAADARFTPSYPGVTDAESMSDWDPPFPVDLKKIDQDDEDYWDAHRTTPKAFVSLEDGLRLWAHDAERFGRYTSMRFAVPAGADAQTFAASTGAAVLAAVEPGAVGLRFNPVRALAEQASSGSTDFGGLFIGFSFFLIIAAALLVALLFRLSIERRSAQLGALLALGWTPRMVRRALLREGLLVAACGASLGLLASVGYAELMLHGLRSWWSAAVNAPFLVLQVRPASVVGGFGAALFVAFLAIRWAMRQATSSTPRALLGGTAGLQPPTPAAARLSGVLAVVLGCLAVLCAVLPSISAAPQAVMFFLSGLTVLSALLCALRWHLRRRRFSLLTRGGTSATIRLGGRNTHRNPARSGLTVALIGSATFVIFALQAFRVDDAPDPADRSSGAGGYAVVAESSVPLLYDLNDADGRRDAGLDDDASAQLADSTVMPFRLQPGDDASCLNLFKPSSNRIVGATPAFIERGGFRFAALEPDAMGALPDNPWTLLTRVYEDGAIPVIGDLNAVQWQLHSGLGKTIRIEDGRGVRRSLRFVALLADSVLQDELVVSEDAFLSLYPERSGYGFFLIATPAATVTEVNDMLERELSGFGFDGVTSASRLAGFRAVQNTYLTTFQALGGVGLIIGTIGLGAVLLRNVLERRRELALMQAVGFTRGNLALMVLAENVLLVAGGLLCGLLAALLAIAPHIVQRGDTVAWDAMAILTALVFVVGVAASAVALVVALGGSLIPALRRE